MQRYREAYRLWYSLLAFYGFPKNKRGFQETSRALRYTVPCMPTQTYQRVAGIDYVASWWEWSRHKCKGERIRRSFPKGLPFCNTLDPIFDSLWRKPNLGAQCHWITYTGHTASYPHSQRYCSFFFFPSPSSSYTFRLVYVVILVIYTWPVGSFLIFGIFCVAT